MDLQPIKAEILSHLPAGTKLQVRESLDADCHSFATTARCCTVSNRLLRDVLRPTKNDYQRSVELFAFTMSGNRLPQAVLSDEAMHVVGVIVEELRGTPIDREACENEVKP